MEEQADVTEIMKLYNQYGEHLLTKGDFDGAMNQFIATIGYLQSSYVIRFDNITSHHSIMPCLVSCLLAAGQEPVMTRCLSVTHFHSVCVIVDDIWNRIGFSICWRILKKCATEAWRTRWSHMRVDTCRLKPWNRCSLILQVAVISSNPWLSGHQIKLLLLFECRSTRRYCSVATRN